MDTKRMTKKEALKALYDATDGEDALWDLFREIAHVKTGILSVEDATRVSNALIEKLGERVRCPSCDTRAEDEYNGTENTEGDAGFADLYPDDDMEDNRLPSERFYDPDHPIPVEED